MKRLHIPVFTLLFIFLTGCFQTYNGYRGGPPKIYDKYGFPIGGKNQFLTNDGFVVRDFQLDLEAMTGVGCSGSAAQEYVRMYMHQEALSQFEVMQSAARKDGVRLSICSAYRDYEHQKQVKRQLPGKAIDAGYSEHHLGTAVDLANVWWSSSSFRWLKANAHQYGFILSYYRTSTSGEANHWRYVGQGAAQQYHDWFGDQY